MKALKFVINGEEQEIAQGWQWRIKAISIKISSYTSSTKTLTATINSWWSVDDLVDGTYIIGTTDINIWSEGARKIIIDWKEFNIIWSCLYSIPIDNWIIARIIGWRFWILEVFNNNRYS